MSVVIYADWLTACYVLSALLFILTLRGLTNQESARMGIWYGVLGMLLCLCAALGSRYIHGQGIWVAIVSAGPTAILAIIMALKIKMTSMPQMVGLLNAFGGLAAALQGVALFVDTYEKAREDYFGRASSLIVFQAIFYLLGVLVGTVTFTGSCIACLKLSGHINAKPRILPGRTIITILLWLLMIGCGVVTAVWGIRTWVGFGTLMGLVTLAGIYGILFVFAIGGADMPVVISVLNSGSGWAGVLTGFMLSNQLMIISGAFVGASGIILSKVMCDAMNRSLIKVLIGGFGDSGRVEKGTKIEGEVKTATVDQVVTMMLNSKNVIVAPGYGMAVSRAQHAVAQLRNALHDRGISVKFAIHPVAGRLPGHMNVLLAEANVPYDIVYGLDEINTEFKNTDLVLIIGANDTVNPAAVFDELSGIYGMPVLEVWNAKHTIVMKRTLASGYAGVDNPLFVYPNNSMLLGDGKETVEALLHGVTSSKIEMSGTVSVCMEVEENAKYTQDAIVELAPVHKWLGVLREWGDECRVAMTPDVAQNMRQKLNIGVMVESGAGINIGFSDDMYEAAGCRVMPKRKDILKNADIIVRVVFPTNVPYGPILNADEAAKAHADCDMIVETLSDRKDEPLLVAGFLGPKNCINIIKKWAEEKKVNILSMDCIPRISTAQKMDILSSTAKLAGYRAVIEAAKYYQSLFTPEITAAGKYPPAKVLVIGAGVAGLQAIGSAHAMGGDVRAFDTRLECCDQVESMGGKFLKMDFNENGTGEGGYAKPMSEEFIAKEMELFKQQCSDVNIVITTAAIPGCRAPVLITEEHVNLLQTGSVIVDLAAGTGGNCAVTKPGEVYKYNNKVTIVGLTNFPSQMGNQASSMFANNVYHMLEHMGGGKDFKIDLNDDIIGSIAVSYKGTHRWPLKTVGPPPPTNKKIATAPIRPNKIPLTQKILFGYVTYGDLFWLLFMMVFSGIFCTLSPEGLPPLLMSMMLSSWVGFLLVWNVTPALHTPLMSVSNAISGIVILGAMLNVSVTKAEDIAYGGPSLLCLHGATVVPNYFCVERHTATTILNALAIAVASMNVFGGFTVTHRMIAMFKKS